MYIQLFFQHFRIPLEYFIFLYYSINIFVFLEQRFSRAEYQCINAYARKYLKEALIQSMSFVTGVIFKRKNLLEILSTVLDYFY